MRLLRLKLGDDVYTLRHKNRIPVKNCDIHSVETQSVISTFNPCNGKYWTADPVLNYQPCLPSPWCLLSCCTCWSRNRLLTRALTLQKHVHVFVLQDSRILAKYILYQTLTCRRSFLQKALNKPHDDILMFQPFFQPHLFMCFLARESFAWIRQWCSDQVGAVRKHMNINIYFFWPAVCCGCICSGLTSGSHSQCEKIFFWVHLLH